MTVGARDYIDQLLVKKYADKQVNNHDFTTKSVVAPEKMLEVMEDYANMKRTMMALQGNLARKMQSLGSVNVYKRKQQIG